MSDETKTTPERPTDETMKALIDEGAARLKEQARKWLSHPAVKADLHGRDRSKSADAE